MAKLQAIAIGDNSMKVYVINKIGWQYNDECYDRPDEDGSGKPIECYRTRANALKACGTMNAERAAANIKESGGYEYGGMRDGNNDLITQFYCVVGPIEIADNDIVETQMQIQTQIFSFKAVIVQSLKNKKW